MKLFLENNVFPNYAEYLAKIFLEKLRNKKKHNSHPLSTVGSAPKVRDRYLYSLYLAASCSMEFTTFQKKSV